MSGGGGVDPFGSRPDEILQHVLSFLPSREAVHASQLSRRWRNLWRSTPAIRILPCSRRSENDDYLLFVNSLLLHRSSAPPLRSFEIETSLTRPRPRDRYDSYDDEDLYYRYDDYEDRVVVNLDPHVDLWISHAVGTCRARELEARFGADVAWEPRSPLAFLASRHLTKIQPDGVRLFDKGLLDFFHCPALLELGLTRCRLGGGGEAPFVSPSLERLSIVSCHMDASSRLLAEKPAVTERTVSTPSLRYLQISDDGEEFREINNPEVSTPPSLPWWTPDAQFSTIYMTILPRDMLSKLNSPENNELCKYDASGPSCLLWQTPLLKGLILQLLRPAVKPNTDLSYISLEESVLEMEGRYDEKERIIKCRKVDARVDEIVKLLGAISLGETSLTNKQP